MDQSVLLQAFPEAFGNAPFPALDSGSHTYTACPVAAGFCPLFSHPGQPGNFLHYFTRRNH